MSSIAITQPQRQDREDICALFASVIHDNFIREGLAIWHVEDMQSEIEYQIHTLDRDMSSNGTAEYYLVARSGNRIVGTIACGTVNAIIRENYSYTNSKKPEIKSVYILPS
jgi:hypothetical protein